MTSNSYGALAWTEAVLLNEVISNTFTTDIVLYKKNYQNLQVFDSVLFMHDGKYITWAGGAKGLVIDRKLEKVPRLTLQ